jgi:hypothetical protein
MELNMRKIIFLLKRKSGMSREEFKNYYENVHSKLAHKYISHLMVSYRRNYPTHAWRVPAAGNEEFATEPFTFGYDCISELTVRDDAAFEEMWRIFRSPEVSKVLDDDERKFLARKDVVRLECEECDTGIGSGLPYKT